MEDAKETLQKAGKNDRFYKDDKYVKTACGIAYNGVLKALDGYFLLKGIEKTKDRKSINYYYEILSRLDKRMLNNLHDAYEVLHLLGYYDGILNISIVENGISVAYNIIDKIKPSEA
ncbi:MAG: DUF5618 family protein [Prevotellaceae bacterium]|jgi:hypothetical protein|nr:DUF5618 family protein [Prevotellaceae bacterium]